MPGNLPTSAKQAPCRNIYPLIIISCAALVVYSNSLGSSFHLDDFNSIIENPCIRGFSWPQIWHFWPCRFITYLSFAFNYHFNGLNAAGYHLVNLLVHMISAILVWKFVSLTFLTPAVRQRKIAARAAEISLFAGLIFAVHPATTEAVTYIVQRASSMATMFYLAALCCYVQSRLETDWPKARFFYACSWIAAILAMFTKENTISLPLMLFVYEACFFEKDKKPPYLFLLSLLVIPLTMSATRSVNFQHMSRMIEGAPQISSLHYFLTQLKVMTVYIALLFLPLSQNLDYDFPVSTTVLDMPMLLGFLVLITVFILGVRLFPKYRLLSFGIFWFFLVLLPESSFLPIQDVIFEHRLYLPLAGYSLLLASGVYYVLNKDIILPTVILMAALTGYSCLAYQRNKVWNSDFSLWTDTVRKSPYKARPHYALGKAYEDAGMLEPARLEYNKAIGLDGRFADAYYNRGNVYAHEGRWPRALADYNRAVELDPYDKDAFHNRQVVLHRMSVAKN